MWRDVNSWSWKQSLALVLTVLLGTGALLGLAEVGHPTQITAGIVNLDEGTELDGEFVPMGRQLAAEMIERGDGELTWVLADSDSARDKLASGEFSAVVTIGKNFSEDAVSFSDNKGDTARQATIEVEVSDNAPITDAAVAQEIALVATEAFNNTLTGQYLDNIYLGFNQVGEQFVDVVEGANQLNDGGRKLNDGVNQATDGTEQLSDGLGELARNGTQLKNGGTALQDGSGKLRNASSQLADGAKELNDGVQELADQVPQLTGGVDRLVEGAEDLAPAITQYTDGTVAALDGVGQLADGLNQAVDGLSNAGGGGGDMEQLNQLVDGANQLSTGAKDLSNGANQLADGADQLADGSKQVSDGVDQLAEGLSELTGAITPEVVAGINGLEEVADYLGPWINELDADLSSYAQGGPVPDDLQELANELKAAFECPLDDEEACLVVQDYVNQRIDAAVAEGFRGGAARTSAFLNAPIGDTGLTPKQQVEQLSSKLQERIQPLSAGVEDLEKLGPALTQLQDGARQVADGNKELATNSRRLAQGADDLAEGNKQFADGIQSLVSELPRLIEEQLKPLRDGLTELSNGANQLVEQTQPLRDNAPQLAGGANQLLSGMQQLRDAVGQLPDGVNQLTNGTSQLADGSRQLADGAATLDDGLGSYTDGVTRYTDAAQQASDASGQLVDGMVELQKGSSDLSNGINTFAEELEKGKEQIPSFSDSDREQLSTVVASPIEAPDQISMGRASTTALIVAAVVWLAGTGAFLVLSPSRVQLITSQASSVKLWWQGIWRPLALITTLGVLLGGVAAWILNLDLARAGLLMALTAGVAAMYAFTNHALASFMGNLGRAIALVLVAVTGAIAVSSKVSQALSPVAAFSPLHAGFTDIRSFLARDLSTGSVAFLLLLLILAAGFSLASIATKRKLSLGQFRQWWMPADPVRR